MGVNVLGGNRYIPPNTFTPIEERVLIDKIPLPSDVLFPLR